MVVARCGLATRRAIPPLEKLILRLTSINGGITNCSKNNTTIQRIISLRNNNTRRQANKTKNHRTEFIKLLSAVVYSFYNIRDFLLDGGCVLYVYFAVFIKIRKFKLVILKRHKLCKVLLDVSCFSAYIQYNFEIRICRINAYGNCRYRDHGN